MLDTKLIREHPEEIQQAAKNKNIDVDINSILGLDKKNRDLTISVQKLREERNKFTQEIKGKPTDEQIRKGRELKEELEKEEQKLNDISRELHDKLLKIPNPPKPDVQVGKDETENEVVRKHKEPTEFTFTPKDHLDLGEALDIIDVKRAAKVSGTRFAYLKGDGVLLEFALVQLVLETLTKEGFIPIVPPVLIKKEITTGLGYWDAPKDKETGLMGNEDYYLVYEPLEKQKELYLVGTAEHAIVPMHKDEILQSRILPLRYVGFSTAFRREAGSYGKDTKGILRVHQFDKVEMVSFVREGEDDKEQEYLLSLEEKLFQLLNIPYQVIKMCTGDLGFPAARKYDIEAWMPGQNKYREVTSVSTVTDFQSRRLSIKYQEDPPAGGKKFVNILNGTAFAIGRTIIAIVENYQQKDGSVVVPEVLRRYLNKSILEPHK